MQVIGVRNGRKWSVDGLQENPTTYHGEGSIDSATEEYVIKRDPEDVQNDWHDVKTYQHIAGLGLPKIGDPHNGDEDSMLRATRIDFAEGTGSDKLYVIATVTYTRVANASEATEATEETEGIPCYCESWGWTNGSVNRDVTAADGGPILNTAGDPYDSVPQYEFPSPVFHKSFKTKQRIDGVIGFYGCVNVAEMEIGGIDFAAGTLRIVQATEERIFNDAGGFRYRYDIGIQYLSNVMKKVYVGTANGWASKEDYDVGWAFVVANTGLRAKSTEDADKVVRIMDKDEAGNEIPVSTPVALDAQGYRVSETADDKLLFYAYNAYPLAAFPEIFYSEPGDDGNDEDEEDGTI